MLLNSASNDTVGHGNRNRPAVYGRLTAGGMQNVTIPQKRTGVSTDLKAATSVV